MFLLKKIVSALLGPMALSFVAIGAGLLLAWRGPGKTTGKVLAGSGLLALLVFGFDFTSAVFLRKLEYQYPPLKQAPSQAQVKWVVVLGGGINDDPRLPLTAQLSQSSLARLIEGIRVHRNLAGSRLLLSGGPVFNRVPEAQAMAGLAVALGIPDSNLVLEDRSMDTEGQARAIKGLVDDQPFVLVTSAAHLPRAMALFRTQGMKPIADGANYMIKRGQEGNPDGFFPGSRGLEKWEILTHECLGIMWGKLTGRM
jgi:uncharacterized SAM-binding protein YcdF (DUF218 family)